MQAYANKPMEELAAELKAGLWRLKKGYVDAAEALAATIDPAKEYPYDFVVYSLTGYRPARSDGIKQMMAGKSLISDLHRLMLDVCESFDLHTSDYPEKVYDTAALARHFSVSTKTIQRWRRQHLAGRKLIFPDGKRRLAFLESSVKEFVTRRRRQVLRSVRFSHMTPAERQEILRRARRMASFTNCRLSEVARRIAARTGRAVETIRYTIRKHDTEHPDRAIFPRLSSPLDKGQKLRIYRSFLKGESVTALARAYKRTRGSIYRIINEVRAEELLHRQINYVYNPQFDLPNADELILSCRQGPRRQKTTARLPRGAGLVEDIPAYLQKLYEVPLLQAEGEQDLFRRYNYLKYKAHRLRQQIDLKRIRTRDLKSIETLLLQANLVKNQIIRANLRLVVSIAKKHLGGPQTLLELISDGNVSLMRAVERFDYSLGYRFSTYASWAIMRNYARSVPKERRRMDRFSTGHEDVLDIAASLRSYDPNELNVPELRESLDAVLSQLSPLERSVLIDHYGLEQDGGGKTLGQLGRRLGVSKERVRQIEMRALQKLRKILSPEKADLLS